MKMYKNGMLWHSGNNKNELIDIQQLSLGSNGKGTGYFWDGKIKELRIFNKELFPAPLRPIIPRTSP